MGSRMAANVARAGHELTVWNRTSARAEEFADRHRAAVATTPAHAAAEAEVVVSMVVDGPQVESILLGSDGAASAGRSGQVFVDCSTIGAAAARALGSTLAERGIAFLDAPVTGSAPRAEDGTLTI